jgi:hypothetical protein
MTEKIIKTPTGDIKLNIKTTYNLKTILSLSPTQLDAFLKIFKITTKGCEGLSDLVEILSNNDLIEGDLKLIHNKHFYFWVSKSFSEIKSLLTTKGIWLEGMTKYFAIKLILFSHSIVEESNKSDKSDKSDIPKSDVPKSDKSDIPKFNPNKALGPPELRDHRDSITTGIHYETLPDRDYNIYYKRSKLKSMLLKQYFNNDNMIKSFSSNHLKTIYEYYDKHSFNYELSDMIKEQHRKIQFHVNLNSTQTAGVHSFSDDTHTIKISPSMIGQLFSKGETSVKANGLIIRDRVSALINIFEHELVHLYCSLKGFSRKIKSGPGKMYYGPHSKLFQALVFRYFGHTDYRHSFNHGDTKDQLSKCDCRIGLDVYFDTPRKGKIYGEILKINPKRCRIITETGDTYDVPYDMLRQSDRKVNVPEKYKPDLNQIKSKYNVGMKVSFNHGKEQLTGKIIKCNPKRARVETSLGVYNVPYMGLK